MKTIILLLTLISPIIVIGASDFTATHKATNGGPNGYYDVSESHDTDEGTSSLNCKNPGGDNCAWTDRPEDVHQLEGGNGTGIYFDDLETHANTQISLDTLSGSFTSNIIVDGENWYRNISWTAIDSNNYDFIISINQSQ